MGLRLALSRRGFLAGQPISSLTMTRTSAQTVKDNPSVIENNNRLYISYYASRPLGSAYDAPDLQIWSIANPSEPGLIGTLPTTFPAESAPYYMAFRGNYAYLTYFKDNGHVLNIIDVSDPTTPVVVTTVVDALLHQVSQIVLYGSYAYLIGNITSNGAGRMDIVDISTPSSPIVVTNIITPELPYGASLNGRYLYISGYGSNTIAVYDLINPTSPALVTTIIPAAIRPMYHLLDSSTNHLYVVENGSGGKLEVFNISNPAEPVSIKSIALTAGAPIYMSMSESRRLLFIPQNGTGDVSVYSIYDPANPLLVSTFNLGLDGNGYQKNATSTAFAKDTLYVSSTTTPLGANIGDFFGYLDAFKVTS